MLKIIGAVLVIVSCTGLGIYEGIELVKHENVMRQIRQMVLLLKGEIQYGNSSLFDVFQRISAKQEGEMKSFLNELAKEMKKTDRCLFYEIFEKSADRKKIMKRMTADERYDFLEFGKNLGSSDRKTQIQQMEMYMRELENDLEQLHLEVREKKRLYRNMGILCGFFLVLMLW